MCFIESTGKKKRHFSKKPSSLETTTMALLIPYLEERQTWVIPMEEEKTQVTPCSELFVQPQVNGQERAIGTGRTGSASPR